MRDRNLAVTMDVAVAVAVTVDVDVPVAVPMAVAVSTWRAPGLPGAAQADRGIVMAKPTWLAGKDTLPS